MTVTPYITFVFLIAVTALILSLYDFRNISNTKGSAGATGPAGLAGATGPSGAVGAAGAMGPPGIDNNTTQSIFFNGSTLSKPAYVLLPTLEVSETSDGITVRAWPDQFRVTVPSPFGWTYNGSGQLFMAAASANLNNYVRWDNIVFGSTGIYSLRAYVSISAPTITNYGIFQATVDSVPIGTTVDLSAPVTTLQLFNNISISAGTHSIGLQCIAPGITAGGFGGQFSAEFFLLVQIS